MTSRAIGAPPSDRLVWVCVSGTMQVFWPACLYSTFSEATDDGHDLQTLRALAPTLDREDAVVYFFGVGANASQHASIAPNLQLCVLRHKALTVFEWDGTDDFDKVCRTHHIPEESMTRALANPTFRRACAHATRFALEASTKEDARRLFLSFFNDDTTVSSSGSPTKPTPTKPAPTPTQATSTPTPTHALPPLPPRPSTKAESPVKTTHTEETFGKLSHELVGACWRHMQSQGWQTLKQANGSQMFIMPGILFVDFKPNVTVFDSLASACTNFLVELARQPTPEVDDVGDLLWAQMIVEGWQSMRGADDTWYVMPNTRFESYVPNVTIFQSKQLAIAKYLETVGVGAATNADIDGPTLDADEEELASSQSDADMSEADPETEDPEVDGSEMEEEDDSPVESSQEESPAEEEEEEEEDSEEEEEEQNEEVYARITRRLSKARPSSSSSSSSAAPSSRGRRPVPKTKHRLALQPSGLRVPPFKLLPGTVEQELAQRGWYWKPVAMKVAADGYMYYQPYCRGRDPAKLKLNQDCFPGRMALDEYLEATGLGREIETKLRREHEQSHTQQLDSSLRALTRKPKPGPPKKTPVAPTVFEIVDSEEEAEKQVPGKRKRSTKTVGASRRKPALEQIKRRQPALREVSYGEIEKKLLLRGWYRVPGKFEYDYIKPGKSRKTSVPGEDYFTSKDAFISYLKDSGLWAQVEEEVRREWAEEAVVVAHEPTEEKMEVEEGEAMDVVEEEPPRSAVLTTTPQKRKAVGQHGDEADDQDKENVPPRHNTPVAKKPKIQNDADLFTPPSKRHPEPVASKVQAKERDEEEEEPATQVISPENETFKAKDSTPSAHSMARSLHEVFTPSPQAEKKSLSHLTPRQLAEAAVGRLTLAFEPQRFAHREDEARQIHDFCRSCFSQRRGGSLYLSGSPGCGKSALVRSLSGAIGQLFARCGDPSSSIVPVHMNAMALHDFGQLFVQLAETLTKKKDVFMDKEDAFVAIERATTTKRGKFKTLLLVLDEIDALATRPSLEPDLCRLFELAHRPHHAFVLVGIANQIDFTERHLAPLKQQLPSFQPTVVVFKPYSFQTISAILTERLGGEADAARVMNVNGIAFIARKVAAQSGDVRLALDICRRVLAHKLVHVDDHSSPALPSLPVPLTDIVKAIKSVMEATHKSNVASLPRNLQMILFAATRLVALAATSTAASASTGSDETAAFGASGNLLYQVEDLYACYCDVSHDAGVFKPLSRSEFRIGLETLSAEGLLGPGELKKSLVKLLCTPSDLLTSFKTDAYFARLI